ncbi:MAG: M23 family metallopeptidase [Gemmatimonadota bacterium]|nr:M23 family metallopeptidase [Gemmatimonadota bacterium]
MKYLTLMVVPYPGADVKSIRIRHRTIKLMSVVAFVLVCTLVSGLFYLKPLLEKAGEYDMLLAENEALVVEYQKIRKLSRKMAVIDKMVNKIQLAQGVKKHEEAETDRELGKDAANYSFLENSSLRETARNADKPSSEGEDVKFTMPYGSPIKEKSYISRFFDPEIYHFGIDLAIKNGTPILTTASGVVTVAEKNEDFGYYVMIKHASGYSTLYAHNSMLTVNKGEKVQDGDLIAYSGNLGLSSGPHLHYAIFDQNGNPIDPLPFLER